MLQSWCFVRKYFSLKQMQLFSGFPLFVLHPLGTYIQCEECHRRLWCVFCAPFWLCDQHRVLSLCQTVCISKVKFLKLADLKSRQWLNSQLLSVGYWIFKWQHNTGWNRPSLGYLCVCVCVCSGYNWDIVEMIQHASIPGLLFMFSQACGGAQVHLSSLSAPWPIKFPGIICSLAQKITLSLHMDCTSHSTTHTIGKIWIMCVDY